MTTASNLRTNLTALLAIIFLSGCARQDGGGVASGDGGKADDWGAGSREAVVIDMSGDGGHFVVEAGQLVVVQLPSNPTTGYDWEVVATSRTFAYPDETDFIPDDPMAEGSGGITELVWDTDRPLSMVGTHNVVLGYVRSWETDVEPDEVFLFSVEIVPAQRCEPVLCELFCPDGFAVDERGCEICECLDPAECEPVLCELYCFYGFDVDERGCEVCECRECPNPDDEGVHYVTESVEECEIIYYDCLEGEEPFSGPCGCGCITR